MSQITTHAQHEANNRAMDERFAWAEQTRFSGTIYGPAEVDRELNASRTVFEYSRGVCTDRYVTSDGER